MIKEAINFVKEILGENQIKVSVHEEFENLYRSLGFESASDMHLEGGLPYLEMVRQLE